MKRLKDDRFVKMIPLTQGKWAFVSASDYDRLMKHKWHASQHQRPHHTPRWYARCHVGGKKIYMHRMLLEPEPWLVVDHIDGNSLNNTRENLRAVTHAENSANRKLSDQEKEDREPFL